MTKLFSTQVSPVILFFIFLLLFLCEINFNLEDDDKILAFFQAVKIYTIFFFHPSLTLLCRFYAFLLADCVFILRCSFKETVCVSIQCIITLTPLAKIKLMFQVLKTPLKVHILIPCHLWISDHKFNFGKGNK